MNGECFKFYERNKIPSGLMEVDLNNIGAMKSSSKLSSSPPRIRQNSMKSKTNKVIDELKLITSQNLKNSKCKDLVDFDGGQCRQKSILRSRDDLNEKTLEELCEWLISGFRKISRRKVSEQKDCILLEIQKNLRQLLILRRRFEEGKPSTKDHEYDFDFKSNNRSQQKYSISGQTCFEAIESCKSFAKTSQNLKSRKCTDAADVIKAYEVAMKRISKGDDLAKFKVTKKDECEDFKWDPEDQSCEDRLVKNRKATFQDNLSKVCKPTSKYRKKSSDRLICQSHVCDDLRDVIKECTNVLNTSNKPDDNGRSRSPNIADINCGRFSKNKTDPQKDFGFARKKISMRDNENTWNGLKKGLKNMDSFYECLRDKIDNVFVGKSFHRQNISDHNNNMTTTDNNSIGLKLYFSIKQKFNHSINILTPVVEWSAQSEVTNNTSDDITNANNLNNAQKPIITQQINNSINGLRFNQSIHSNNNLLQVDQLKIGTTTKPDWRSKIEYWDITSADVKEISTTESLYISTPDQLVGSVNSQKVAGRFQTRERVRGFFTGDATTNSFETPNKIDKESIKFVVNSNVNAGQREVFANPDICRTYKNQTSSYCNKKTNNSNNIHNRPPWKPINTSRPPSRRKFAPPPQIQNCLGMPNTTLPVTNNVYSECYNSRNYAANKDVSNNNCCYCCQPDCCCQQLLFQLQFQQHCRYLEEMFERKQVELKEEIQRLNKCPSTNKFHDPCSNFTPNDNIIKDCLNKLQRNNKCDSEGSRHWSFMGSKNERNLKDCYGSWWVGMDQKEEERRNSKCPSRCGSEHGRNSFRRRQSKSSKNESITERCKELFQKISSSSSSSSSSCDTNFSKKTKDSRCDSQIDKKRVSYSENKSYSDKKKDSQCDSHTDKTEDSRRNSQSNKKRVSHSANASHSDKKSSCSRSCQTDESKKECSHSECQTFSGNSKKSSDEPAHNDLDMLRPSIDMSIQTGVDVERVDVERVDVERVDLCPCEVEFRKCMSQARGALLDQGPTIDKWERNKLSCYSGSRKSKSPQNDDFMMECMLNFDASKITAKCKDCKVQSIINAFREKCQKSKKQFRDLRIICKGKQLLDSCMNDPTLEFDVSKICGDLKLDGDKGCYLTENKSPGSYNCENIKLDKDCSIKRRPTWNKDKRGDESDKLVHCWIERSVKDKMLKNENFLQTSCDDATWDCQDMLDNSPECNLRSITPNSKRAEKRNQIIEAIESYCREFGSIMPEKTEGTSGRNYKKKELFKELKKCCRSIGGKQTLTKLPENRDKHKEGKSFFDKIRGEKKNKKNKYSFKRKGMLSGEASSSSSCKHLCTASSPFKSRSDSESSYQKIENSKEVKNLVSFRKCLEVTTDSEGKSDTIDSFSCSEIQRKFDNMSDCSKRYRNRSHSNRYCTKYFPETSDDDDEIIITSNRGTHSSPSNRHPHSQNSKNKSKGRANTPSLRTLLDFSSNSRESLVSCLNSVLTKSRFQRAIQDGFNFDIKRSQSKKIKNYLQS